MEDDFRDENLKQLVIARMDADKVENTTLIKMVNACPNLEWIMLSDLGGITSDDVKGILENHPKMTHLCLEFYDFELDHNTMSMLQDHGKNLKYLKLTGLTLYPSYSELRAFFGNDFPIIKFIEDGWDEEEEGDLTMRKRNISDWYQSFFNMGSFFSK